MAELVRMKDMHVSHKSFRIMYWITTGDRRINRTYFDVVKYPAYKTTELQDTDKKTRAQYENESIERTKEYCESRGEEVYSWVILDKDNKRGR